MKRIWNWLDGKKTIIGVVGHLAWFTANLILKDLTTSNEALVGHGIISSITTVGIGGKINKAINRAKSPQNK